jgi:predicted dehydrogenase
MHSEGVRDMSDRVRVGFVGTGGIAVEAHLPALREIEGVEIAALCDVSKERAKAACEEFGGRAYGDHHEMLESEELDALYVCLPPDAHTDAEVMAAGKGVHLFLEKPIALTMEKCTKIAEAIRKANVISSVGYQMRYTPVAEAARGFLAGKPVALVAANRWGQIPGGPQHWWRVMERSGGMFHEMATHQMDLIRYVVGDVRRVHARYGLNVLKDVENLTVPDAQMIVLEFQNGAIGYFSTSCALTKGGSWSSVDIILRDMMLRIAYRELTVIPEAAADIALPPAGMNIDEAFIHAVRTGDRSVIRSDFFDALKTTEVTLGANESAKTGKPVDMKLA